MTDVHGAHPGLPGHTVLALRSSGVKAPPELSTPGSNQLQTPADHLGGNCKSNRPLILVEVHPLFSCQTRGHFPFCPPPPPRSAVCLLLPHTLPSFFGYIHPIIVMGGHFLWRVEKLRFSRSGANRTTISTDSCVTVHARSSGVPADKHTSLHRASCLQNTAAVFSCVYSASAQQHFSNNSFCTWSTAARM